MTATDESLDGLDHNEEFMEYEDRRRSIQTTQSFPWRDSGREALRVLCGGREKSSQPRQQRKAHCRGAGLLQREVHMILENINKIEHQLIMVNSRIYDLSLKQLTPEVLAQRQELEAKKIALQNELNELYAIFNHQRTFP